MPYSRKRSVSSLGWSIGSPVRVSMSVARNSGLTRFSGGGSKVIASIGSALATTGCVRVAWNRAYCSGGSESFARRSATCRAAASPTGKVAFMLSKLPAEKLPSSGRIRTSVGPSEASDCRTFCSVRMPIICPVMPSTFRMSSRRASGVPRLTAMTMSAPISRATSTGRLFTRPPSTSIMPSNSAGAMIPGTDMLARIASARSPLSNTFGLPVTRSVATARKGIGSVLKST